jgi:hypothetical protein
VGLGLDPDRAYRMSMRDDLRGPLAELKAWAYDVGTAIVSRMSAVNDGQTVRSRKPRREWSFRKEEPFEREYYQRQTGLRIEFVGQPMDLDCDDDSAAVANAFREMLVSVARKFDGHEHATRILVVDPHGDLRWSGSTTWKDLLADLKVPAEIDQVCYRCTTRSLTWIAGGYISSFGLTWRIRSTSFARTSLRALTRSS